MKRIHLTQVYELTVTVDVDVPDNYTLDDMTNSLSDFPINATVETLWDEMASTDDEDIIIGSLCVDSLVSLGDGLGMMILLDENGNDIREGK